MPSPSLTTLFAVWGVTTLSRLPPGALTLAAVRTADDRGVRAAAAVLAGALVAELAVTAVLIAGGARLPREVFQDERTRRAALSLALAAAGAVLLWPVSGERSRACQGRPGVLAAAGFGVTLSTPGLWSWWATVGAVVVAVSGQASNPLELFVAMAAGLATSHMLLLVGLGTGVVRVPRLGVSVRLGLGVALLLAAGLVAVLG